QLGWTHQEGRLLDGLSRPHRFMLWVSPALLNPAFADGGGRIALGAGIQYAWDTRVASTFPLRGRRLVLGTDGGFVPGTEETWSALRWSLAGVTSPHPRVALAARFVGGLASGEVTHRLLAL